MHCGPSFIILLHFHFIPQTEGRWCPIFPHYFFHSLYDVLFIQYLEVGIISFRNSQAFFIIPEVLRCLLVLIQSERLSLGGLCKEKIKIYKSTTKLFIFILNPPPEIYIYWPLLGSCKGGAFTKRHLTFGVGGQQGSHHFASYTGATKRTPHPTGGEPGSALIGLMTA